ncbi:MAG: cytidylate kinase-like family protein [Firmicutes bacterium]|nr:cytidylate kinase-like family protein [Bacillota bacterium]
MSNRIVTIARQYGASGRFTGELLSEATGMPYYDRELITMSADRSGVKEEVLESHDEKAQSSLLYTLAIGSVNYGINDVSQYTMPMSDKLFVQQSNLIHELAKKSSCIIVGRCADYVLRDEKNIVRVFLKADLNVRAERVAQRHSISLSEAQSMCIKTDKRRANYYSHYTGQKWGQMNLYDLVIDTTKIDAKGASAVIKAYIEVL